MTNEYVKKNYKFRKRAILLPLLEDVERIPEECCKALMPRTFRL